MAAKVDKSKLKCNKPRKTPGHKTKSHIVKACENGKEKIIRFGQQGVSTAGKKQDKKSKARRASFKARHYVSSVKDDAAHIDYLKRDIKYDAKHSGSDKQMTDDEKHISKLAGDMKYDKKHHGSPAKAHCYK